RVSNYPSFLWSSGLVAFLLLCLLPRLRCCSLFLFYGYGYHRDLHSFPTRRSSDLHRVLLPMGRAHDGRNRRSLRSAQHGEYASLDRKSTRLNSSHQIISYAVFCLKKKKKRRPPHMTRRAPVVAAGAHQYCALSRPC